MPFSEVLFLVSSNNHHLNFDHGVKPQNHVGTIKKHHTPVKTGDQGHPLPQQPRVRRGAPTASIVPPYGRINVVCGVPYTPGVHSLGTGTWVPPPGLRKGGGGKTENDHIGPSDRQEAHQGHFYPTGSEKESPDSYQVHSWFLYLNFTEEDQQGQLIPFQDVPGHNNKKTARPGSKERVC